MSKLLYRLPLGGGGGFLSCGGGGGSLGLGGGLCLGGGLELAILFVVLKLVEEACVVGLELLVHL